MEDDGWLRSARRREQKRQPVRAKTEDLAVRVLWESS